jgi:hypothetical protein
MLGLLAKIEVWQKNEKSILRKWGWKSVCTSSNLRSDGWLMDGQGISPQQGLEK